MPDYSKLTVVKLREELQKRGLPKTGLKPILVQRLSEADAQSQEVGSTKDAQAVEPSILKSKKAAVDEPPPPAHAEASGGVGDGEAHINGSDSEERQPSNSSKIEEPTVTIDSVTENVVSSDIQPAKEAESEETKKELPPHPVDDAASVTEKDVAQETPAETLVDTALRAPDGIIEESSAIEGASAGASGAIPHSPEKTLQKQVSTHIIPTEPPSDEVDHLSANENSNEVQQLDIVDVTEKEGASLIPSTEEKPLPSGTETAESTQLSEKELIEEKSSLTKNTELTESTQALVSVTTSEVLEDSRKRKRRSQSPVPSSIEITQKRKKMESFRSDVKLPEDVTGEAQAAEASTSEDITMVVPEVVMEEPKVLEASTSEDTTMVDATSAQPQTIVPNSLDTQNSSDKPGDIISKPTGTEITAPTEHTNDSEPRLINRRLSDALEEPQADLDETSLKPSSSDTRFKNLFPGSSKREVSPTRQLAYPDQDDRVVSPAVHPATSALYIRNFMRPLHSGHLQDHLNTLARPSGSTGTEPLIREFHVDNIRTHCLVRFVNTSAASRVRSNLHNRVWPDERTRRPLWVDFVPEEKLKTWIEIQRAAASTGRGQPATRWEIVFEDERDGTKAYLQEVGSGPPGLTGSKLTQLQNLPRPETAVAAAAGQGVHGAPSGPRSREIDTRAAAAQAPPSAKPVDRGRGFQALDDLFRSTVVKPKLYYLPVSKSTADKRLDKLDAGRGGGRGGNELRKYTFEDALLVDRGPLYGARGRGGHGHGGGGGGGRGYGGFHGRGGGGGGGHRGDNWRDRR